MVQRRAAAREGMTSSRSMHDAHYHGNEPFYKYNRYKLDLTYKANLSCDFNSKLTSSKFTTTVASDVIFYFVKFANYIFLFIEIKICLRNQFIE